MFLVLLLQANLLLAAASPVSRPEPAGGKGGRDHISSATVAGIASDLALKLIDVTDGVYPQGATISILTEVENIGTGTSDVSTIDYYASTDTDITHDDVHLGGQAALPAFAAGQSHRFVSFRSIPGDLPSGDYYIGGIITVVDADDTNHVNHDATPVEVNADPEIRIRPLSLEFVEEASPPAGVQVSSNAARKLAWQQTSSIYPSLLRTARGRGFVRVIVGFDNAIQTSSIQGEKDRKTRRERILDTGGQLIASLARHKVDVGHQFETIPFMAMTVDDMGLQALMTSPLVRSIEEDKLSRPFMSTSNPVIGSPMAWAEGYDGSGWAVAVLDTGVEASHSWFSTGGDRIVSEACYNTNEAGVSESLCPGGVESSVAEGAGANIEAGIGGWDHGTHVAGIVAGNDGSGIDHSLGVAPGADIISMQVFSRFLTEDDCGSRAPCLLSTDSDQIAAMERVLQLSESMNIAAINMSLGGDEYPDQASCDQDNLSRKAVIQNLRDAGIATVIAAGNYGLTDAIAAPGCISNAISVGATDDRDNVASFSNVYPQLHLLAPGVGIYSSIPPDKIGSKQGTSMSAPHVAGAWAVMKQRMPLATVQEVLDAFTGTATRVADQRVSGSSITSSSPDGAVESPQTFARINLDMALGEPRTSFGIFNDGLGPLSVNSIVSEPSASWVRLVPEPPFVVEAGGLQVVSVVIDYESAPSGDSQLRLLVESDDPDENPYPEGVSVNIRRLAGDEIFRDDFESR